jgi:hypothetical protein
MALTNEEREEWKAKINWEKTNIPDPWDNFARDWLFPKAGDSAPDELLTFGDAPDNVRDDDVLARFAVEKSSDNLYNCSDRLRNDADFAKMAIETDPYKDSQDCCTLRHCSKHLRDSDAFVRFAVETSRFSFEHCSERMRDDYAFARFALEKSCSTFSHCSDRLRNDADFSKMAIEKCPYNFRYCSDRLRDDNAFARFALEKSELIDDEGAFMYVEIENFVYCSDRLKADPLTQAYKDLVEAEWNRKYPDLTAFPKTIQDAWNIHTPLLSTGKNDKEARSIFVVLAKSAIEAEARRQQSPSDQVHDTDPVGIDAEDLLPELADISIDPYANHPARALKPPSDDDGPDHDLHRGPR